MTRFSLILFVATIGGVLALQCNEDLLETGPDDEVKWEVKDCDEGTDFCAKLHNGKTGEYFRACATKKMCRKSGAFEYQQHPELSINCCDSDACNSAATMGIVTAITAFFSFHILANLNV